jgi:hypothetical protein
MRAAGGDFGVICCARAKMGVLAMAIIIVVVATITPANLHAQKGQARINGASVDLWFAGDVNLGGGGGKQLNGIAGMVQGAAGIVNLEGPVAVRAQLSKTGLRLWNSPASLKELSALNVNVAGIANNHSSDAGEMAVVRTTNALQRNHILPAGESAGPATLHLRGLTIIVTAHDLTQGVPHNLEAELRDAAHKCDFLIATFHVTGPPSYLPHIELKEAVDIAYKSGAVVIVAHGTHAVAKVERREHAVIAWGLGNLAFACDCTKEEDAMILRVRLVSGKVPEARVIAIKAGLNKTPAAPARDSQAIFDLLEAIGSSKLKRNGDEAAF